MEAIAKSEIFFFITSIVVVILGIIAIAAGVFVIKILKDLSVVSKKIRQESELISEDIKELRSRLKEEGRGWTHFLRFFKNVTSRSRGAGRKKSEPINY